MSSVWIFQKKTDLRDRGEKLAPWYVGWYEPDGKQRVKSCGTGFLGKKDAEKLRLRIQSELVTGTYQDQARSGKLWPDFRAEYERRAVEGLALPTRLEVRTALNHFARIVKPRRVSAITTKHIDDYIAARRQERGRADKTLSPATLNKDLRHIKAALSRAEEWGYLPRMPRFHMEKVEKKIATYVPPDDFARIYQACDVARWPDRQPFPPGDWWRALLVTGYMTGWRIGALLALQRSDVDLKAATALSQAADNKGKRDQFIPLHPIVVAHLERLAGLSPLLFPWNHPRRALFDAFEDIQRAAGVRPDRKHHYGFHDLRRAFATMNADKLTPDALQALMQHRTYTTTQGYINMARQLKPSVAGLFVPELGRRVAN
jgi:integrase